MTIACLEMLSFGLAHLVRAARAAGERIVLLTGVEELYLHELAKLPPEAIQVVAVDTNDREAVSQALRAIEDLRGLISSTDTWGVTGAELAVELGLPGIDPAVIRLARDKSRVRDLLHGSRLSPFPAFAVDDVASLSLDELAAAVGLPAVVKDTAGTSSRNVWLVRDADDFARLQRQAAGATLFGRLFAEPFLAGPVYSAETVTWAGRTRMLGMSSRLMSPQPWFREDVTAFPVALPPDEFRAIEDWLGDVLAVLGYTDRFAHVELAMTADGPRLIEVNPRIGGALVGESMCRALDVNVYGGMIDLALGRRPRLLDMPLGGGPAVAFVLAYPDRSGDLVAVHGLDDIARYPGRPEWYPTRAVGASIEHLNDGRGYVGILLAEGPTAEIATHRAVAAAGAVRVETRPAC
ncbi:ATP-grasp domain-containing protein [Micromonospora sp. HM134]|uniref:Argininosuccinate lyase n=1 Tax=Micromonospora wenchangensis TaxID=1185415 RepID=A0A2D0AWX1_9ACTN|nr:MULTISPECIES: ATP-grasp domain-containing protein [Micromonospora]OWV09476.1 argininosuccinate lyase [Micromonospora wenchangensis]QDY09525.1 ATP-grasp domain-containing protein [Micromonospora sp. HM134]